MSPGRLSIELEMGPHGPAGTARDETGRITAFSGWLELIALIDAPTGALIPHREEPLKKTE